jgi:hypothetical protein
MYSMWEVHQLVTERHTSLLHDTKRERLLRQLQAVPGQDNNVRMDVAMLSESDTPRQLQAARNRWGWLAGVLGHWYQRRPEAAQR